MSVLAEATHGLFAAFAARDEDALLELIAPDVEFWPAGTAPQAGRTGPYRGHAGMREYLRDVAQVWRALEVEPDELREAGQAVVAFGTARGTRSSGEQVTVPVIWVFKFRDGLLLKGRVVATAAEAAREMQATK